MGAVGTGSRKWKISDGDCQLYFFRDTGEGQVPISILNEAELVIYNHYKTPAKQREFLIGRMFLKKVLSLILNKAITDIQLDIQANGRLSFSEEDLDVNLSHSFGGFALALGKGIQVGVDIEFLDRKVNNLFLEHVFAPIELEEMRRLPADEQRARFFQLWTHKEAIWKALDHPESLLFNDFYFTFQPTEFHAWKLPISPSDWAFYSYPAHPEYLVSAAASFYAGNPPKFPCFDLQMEDFFE